MNITVKICSNCIEKITSSVECEACDDEFCSKECRDLHSCKKNAYSQDSLEKYTNQSDSPSERSKAHNSVQNSSNNSLCPSAQVSHLPSPSEVRLAKLPKVISKRSVTKRIPYLKGLPPQEGRTSNIPGRFVDGKFRKILPKPPISTTSGPSAIGAPQAPPPVHNAISSVPPVSLPSSYTEVKPGWNDPPLLRPALVTTTLSQLPSNYGASRRSTYSFPDASVPNHHMPPPAGLQGQVDPTGGYLGPYFPAQNPAAYMNPAEMIPNNMHPEEPNLIP